MLDYNGTTRNVSAISISIREYSKKNDTFPISKDLAEINGVGTVTEKKLKEAGFNTTEMLTSVSDELLAQKAVLSIRIEEISSSQQNLSTKLVLANLAIFYYVTQ